MSNTLLLEKKFGWSGILAEPALKFHDKLRAGRQCTLDFRCVWSKSGERLTFNETDVGELSTLEQFSTRDQHSDARKNAKNYQVDTVSLDDLLKHHNAPKQIDYMSVDTEGSELDILREFDFSAYDISVVTIEHNYEADTREQIFRLMDGAGYNRVFTTLSAWDDWYVKRGFTPAS